MVQYAIKLVRVGFSFIMKLFDYKYMRSQIATQIFFRRLFSGIYFSSDTNNSAASFQEFPVFRHMAE